MHNPFRDDGMTLTPHWLSRRILLPVVTATVLLVTVVLLLFVLLINNEAERELGQGQAAARAYWAVDVQHHTTKLEGALFTLGRVDNLPATLAAGEREKIERKVGPLYQEYLSLQGFEHLTFIDRERRVVLRLHAPALHGDEIPSLLVREAEQTGKIAAGLELGRFGLELQAVLPLQHEGEPAGMIVLGESLEHLLEHMDSLFQLSHAVLIDNAYLARRDVVLSPETWGEWDELPGHLLLQRTALVVPEEVRRLLVREQLNELEAGRLIECQGCYNFVSTLPLVDSTGETFGHVVLLRDVTAARASLVRTIITVVALALLATVLLLWLLYRITHRAETQHLALFSEVKEGRRAWEDAFDAIREPIFLHDQEFRIVRANHAYAELAGQTFQEIIGRPYWEAFPKGKGPLPKCGATLSGAIDLEVGGAHEEEIRLPDGRFFLSRAFYTTHPDGSFRYSVHVLEEMTEREAMAEALKRENRLRRIISTSNQALIKAQDEQQLLDTICRIITEQADYPLAWVGFTGQDARQTLRPVAAAGLAPDEWGLLPRSWAATPEGDNPAGRAIRSAAHVFVADVKSESVCEACRRLAAKLGYRSILAFPLLDGDKPFGALTIAAVEPAAFTESEIELLAELAGDLAYGLVAQRSEGRRHAAEWEREQLLLQLEMSLDKTVLAMARAMEARDPYTAGHQERVAQLATAIAKKMELTASQVESIRIAATVHDIGKINIPAEILSKPGRLSPIEFELIKGHSAVGHDLLKGIDFPWPVAQMVRQHHERLDGSGYPDGLAGDDILLEARIIAVADVMEAMSSHRPYRPALPVAQALDEIESHKGVHYDPRVVDACVRLFNEGGFKWQSSVWS